MIPREEELIYRTRWLVRVRWVVVGLMCLGALASFLLHLTYPVIPLLLVAFFVGAYNLLFAVTARFAVGRSMELIRAYRLVNIQIAADFLALLTWVHYTGGPASPFLPFFVFHLVICGLLVSARMTLVHAAWVLGALALMGLAEVRGWLYHWSPLEPSAHGIVAPIGSTSYLLAVGLVIVVTFLTISMVVGGIATRLRRRERELDSARQALEEHAQQIEQAHAKLEELGDERSAFFRLVSHQLRSPLASIQTVLKLVTSGYAGEPEKVGELIGRAELQSQHMLALINDMLSLTRVRSMQEARDKEMVAIAPLLADVVEGVQQAARSKGVVLAADVDNDVPSIPAVRNNVRQLFAVLVENAVKYTPSGGTVDVRASEEDGWIRVAVQDTGIGVPKEERAAIFGEFCRAPNARAHARVGTGLGLTIAQKIARDLGGRIELDSVLGQGSTFTAVIPVPNEDA